MRSLYIPNEAQIRNLMRFTSSTMSEASRALIESHGDWDDAVAIIESRAARQRRHTSSLEVAHAR